MDLPERQRTLRATVEWSVGLLDDAERSLLEIAAVFVDGWTIEAAAQVAGLDEDRALELSEALARHSLIYLDSTGAGPRSRMLETIRAFVAERLAARPDVAEIGRRHADYYRALAEQADRPLRGAGQSEWLERLEAEAGNLAAAVRWYLAHDPGPLPHLFRVLWLFWFLRDHLGEARVLGRAAAAHRRLAGPPGPGRAGCGRRQCIAVDVGRRRGGAGGPPAPGTAAGRDPRPLPARGVPAGHGVELADRRRLRRRPAGGVGLAWRSSAARTSRSGRRMAAFTARLPGDGAGPLRRRPAPPDARRATWRSESGITWLVAVSRVQLGILAVLQGRLEEARALLDEALELSLAARSTRSVTLCLAAFARLAFVDGRPGGRRCWQARPRACAGGSACGPGRMLRRSEAELVAQVRQALGAERFDQAVRRRLRAQPAGGGGRRPRRPAAAVLPSCGRQGRRVRPSAGAKSDAEICIRTGPTCSVSVCRARANRVSIVIGG